MRVAALSTALLAAGALAAPLSTDEIGKICKEADGAAHCARRIEEVQQKRLPNLVRRDGNTLFVRLFPSGEARFEDVDTLSGGTSYGLFDFVNELNAVVLLVVKDDTMSFLLLMRASGRQTPLPSAPAGGPDRTRFATADFCPSNCENEVVVWKVDRDGVRRELSWRPAERWSDATVAWTAPDAIEVEYTRDGETASRKLERRLGDPGWTRVPAR